MEEEEWVLGQMEVLEEREGSDLGQALGMDLEASDATIHPKKKASEEGEAVEDVFVEVALKVRVLEAEV